MPLTPGTRLGSYEVTALLGVGGMGEVYRARDVRLQRDVAIKALPDAMAGDAERIARFEREAQVLASLNHPNIAAIYGLEQLGQSRYLVLEFVDGQSLADRLVAGRLSLDEATAIARQILDALEAAHDKGIVHRDIKPANIMIQGAWGPTPTRSEDGRLARTRSTADISDCPVKLLDFGLARVADPEGGSDISNSPTLTARATQAGMILGTAAYMSPEQAKGRTADKRSDVWAFGCVLYEMLSGKRAFGGEDVSETLAAVLRDNPDLSALPAEVPSGIQSLLRRCLERDRKARIPEVSTVRFLLQDALAAPAQPAVAPRSTARRPSFLKRAMPVALAVIGTATSAIVGTWYLRPAAPAGIARFMFSLSSGELFTGIGRHVVAVSPDGMQVIYIANNRLNLRSISELHGKPISGTEAFGNLTDPAFSPDGRSVVFWAGSDRTLKRMPVSGGAAVTICAADNPYGIRWDENGLVFGQGSNGIMRVLSAGGAPQQIVQVKPGEFAQSPQILPGGDVVLFTLATGNAPDRWDKAQIVTHSLRTGQRTIIAAGTDAQYVSTGHLIYFVRGVLFGAPFDPRRLEGTGVAVPLVEGIRRSAAGTSGAAHYGVSKSGALVYVPGPVGAGGELEIALADRKGGVARLSITPGAYQVPRASPDGSRILVGTDDGKEAAVWVYDLSGTTAIRRLTFKGNNRFPIWTSDSKRVVFQSDSEGDLGIFWQPADGTGAPERLTKPAAGEQHVPSSWSPRGDHFLFTAATANGMASLWTGSMPDKTTEPFDGVRSSTPIGGLFSPDGQWVAYTSTEQGRTTVYVQPFPPSGAKYQLPTKGTDTPCEVTWSPDGRELFYWPRAGGFEAVSVVTKPAFGFGNPEALPRQFTLSGPAVQREYDVTKDGKFVVTIAQGQAVAGGPSGEIVVVLNWFEELKQRVPR